MTSWQKCLFAALFIVFGAWLFSLSVGIKNNSASLKGYKIDDVYEHDGIKDYVDSKIITELGYLRNELKFDLGNDRAMLTKEVLQKLMYYLDLSMQEGNIFDNSGGTDFSKTKGWRGNESIEQEPIY